MLIVCPHTPDGLHNETWEAVNALSGLPGVDWVEFVCLPHQDSYWQLLADLWAAAENFVIVEQDIVPHAGVIAAFADCPEPWCSFGYDYDRFGLYHGSGCVRYRRALMRLEPDLIERVGETDGGQLHPPKHWCTLDAFTQMHLGARGYRQHQHEPPVRHLSPVCSHGCVPN